MSAIAVDRATLALFSGYDQEQPGLSPDDPRYYVRQHACPDCGAPAHIASRRVVVDHLFGCKFSRWADFFRR